MSLTLSLLKETFAIYKFGQHSSIPDILLKESFPFVSITKTTDELSIVCNQAIVLEHAQAVETDWRALKIEGPLDFALTGILSSLLQPLAEQKISIFAVSTYNTDYLLIKNQNIARAVEVLRKQCIFKI